AHSLLANRPAIAPTPLRGSLRETATVAALRTTPAVLRQTSPSGRHPCPAPPDATSRRVENGSGMLASGETRPSRLGLAHTPVPPVRQWSAKPWRAAAQAAGQVQNSPSRS